MNLVIVESPAKTKTISKYLGKDYVVKSSIGHVRDLPKSNKEAIDIDAGFVPKYEISPGKEDVIEEIEKLAKKAKEVILATDPDREGEAIAWHVAQATGVKKPVRVTFNEITKEAVLEAMKKPGTIDLNLKTAQEARRVLDRLFGYDLSGLIWKKVRYGLSAGRVQSPALRILMEREREVRKFIPEKYWVITAEVENKEKKSFVLTCSKEPKEKKEVTKILNAGKKGSWAVTDIKERSVERSPKPPFITSTLQQTASSRLGFPPSKTMSIAQKLYERGLITYMRTDSTTLSATATKQIAAVINFRFGKEYYSPRTFKKKSKGAQEAHEAIRPTKFAKDSAGTTPEQKRLYRLIWERAVASQMVNAKILRTKVVIEIEKNGKKEKVPFFFINGSRIVFNGWYLADAFAKKEDIILPKLEKDEILKLLKISEEEKETTPPNRYSEAGLIKELEKRGIGRPSTYAAIIKTLKDRHYVEKIGSALHPTDTGDVVSTFLEKNFANYISDSFTAEMEKELDEIAEGKRKYKKTLKDFYGPFTKDLKAKKDIEKITNLGKAEAKFKCPECGKPMIIKLGKNGKFMSCKNFPKCTGARTIDGKVMEGPKKLKEKCPKCDEHLVRREGRFGKFISCSAYPKCKFIKMDEKEEAKRRTGVKCPNCKDGEITERNGRFGIFYSCNNYPDCKFAIKAKPTGKKCTYKREDRNGEKCGALMMEGTKTIPTRCSDKTCPNHNPHKLEK